MKMDENERGNLTRLMKVKDMIVNQALEKARQRDARASLDKSF
jgi:V/A-type H+-transporting ATPase subunit D